MIKGAIFDMDGVVVDNVRHHTEAWKQFGLELGQRLSDEEIKRLFGKRNQEILRSLLKRDLSADESERYGNRKEELYRSLMAPDLRPIRGLQELLEELRRSAVKTAVATSGPPDNTRFVLEGLRFEGYFDVVVNGADAPRSKPDPGIFLLAAERLALDPAVCVVFEDSPVGLKGARAAGCLVVALATTHTPDELNEYKPDLIARDFTSISWDALSRLQAKPLGPR